MSKFPSFGRQMGHLKSHLGKAQTNIFFGRVLDVSITPNTTTTRQTNWKYKRDGEWDFTQTGFIKFHPIGTQIDVKNLDSAQVAAPLITNIAKYPVNNEIVCIFPGPSIGMNEGNPTAIKYYYLTVTSLWNNIQHNAFPDLKYIESSQSSNNPSNQSISSGIQANPFDAPEELKFGDTFEENDKIRSLLPSEGDVIIEGRFGNSIRFGSSAPKQQPRNDWSTEAENGKPVVIIRNGQKDEISNNPWDPIFESINDDGSSIYMLSGQPLRSFQPAYINLQSLNLNLTSAGDTSQEISTNMENLRGLGDDFSGTANPSYTSDYIATGQVVSSSLSLEDQDKLQQELKDLYTANNFDYEEDIWKVNITGIRSPGKEVTNLFDDTLVVTYKDENQQNQVYQFPITTQPGVPWLKEPYSSIGAAILKPGQYKDAYKFGRHGNPGYEAIIDAKDLIVFRDSNRDLNYDDPNIPTQTGEFGINIHRSYASGTATKVNRYSAGCQVFANSEDFKVFLNILTKSYQYLGIAKRKFRITYTLIET